MSQRLGFAVFSALIALALIGSGTAFSAEKAPPQKTERPQKPENTKGSEKKDDKLKPPTNIFTAKGAPQYVQMPNINLAVAGPNNQGIRVVAIEAWVDCGTPEQAAKVNSRKKQITEAMREEGKGKSWDEFDSPTDGLELAREMVKASVLKSVADVKSPQILIQSLVLH